MRVARLLVLLAVASCIPAVVGGVVASGAERTAAEPVSWRGAWHTTYGRMVLHQKGSKVTGTYAFCGGKITGHVSGLVLKGTWHQRLGCDGTDIPEGPFRFRRAASGMSFRGTWSYAGHSETGPWTGTRLTTGDW